MDYNEILKTLMTGGFLTALIKIVKDYRESLDIRRRTDKILLRDSVKHNINDEIKKGFTTGHKHEEITESYNIYRSLGGNGTVERLYNKYNTLEIKGD